MKNITCFLIVLITSALVSFGFCEAKVVSGQSAAQGRNQEDWKKTAEEIIGVITEPPFSPQGDYVLFCPFTDSANMVTEDSLAIYFPTLFKASYSPGNLILTPHIEYIKTSAHIRDFLKPGKVVSEQDIKDFVKAFGCRNYVTGNVQEKGDIVKAQISFYLLGKEGYAKTASVSKGDFHLLPTAIARLILEEITGKLLPWEDAAFLQIPAAKSPELLRNAGGFLSYAFYDYQRNWDEKFGNLMDQDPGMEWLLGFYLIHREANDESLNLLAKYFPRWERHGFFPLLYPDLLNRSDKEWLAFIYFGEIKKAVPENLKAYEILFRSLKKYKLISRALPLVDRITAFEPDNAWSHYILGSNQISLAWEHRGTGFAREVTEEGWKGFEKYLGEARLSLQKAIELDPKNYKAWGDLITLGRGQNLSKTKLKNIFNMTVSINPNHRDAYMRLHTALEPKWGGSIPELQAFWNEILNKNVENHYVYTVVMDGCRELCRFYSYDFDMKKMDYDKYRKNASMPHIWPWIERSYEKFFSDGFEDLHQRAIYGLMAFWAEKYELSFEQFEKCNMQFRDTRLIPYDELLSSYAFSAWKTGHYERAEEITRRRTDYKTGIRTKPCEDFIIWLEQQKTQE